MLLPFLFCNSSFNLYYFHCFLRWFCEKLLASLSIVWFTISKTKRQLLDNHWSLIFVFFFVFFHCRLFIYLKKLPIEQNPQMQLSAAAIQNHNLYFFNKKRDSHTSSVVLSRSSLDPHISRKSLSKRISRWSFGGKCSLETVFPTWVGIDEPPMPATSDWSI